MLNAILSSKSGRLRLDDQDAIRWREVFRTSEDLLTATVIERLSYLPPDLTWQILVAASNGRIAPYRLVDLQEIEFWPMWDLEGRARGVEPDVFIRLALGDPPRDTHVIVETKHGASQRVTQWTAEIRGWLQYIADGEIEQPESLVFLAIEGNDDDATQAARRKALLSALEGQLPEDLRLSVVTLAWLDILRASKEVEARNTHEGRILDDIGKGLELCGYFDRTVPRQLEKLRPLVDPEGTLAHLMTLNAPKGA